MIMRSITRKVPGFTSDGEPCLWIQDTGQMEPIPCVECQGESSRQVCPTDGRSHWHGMVHAGPGGWNAYCSKCILLVPGPYALEVLA